MVMKFLKRFNSYRESIKIDIDTSFKFDDIMESLTVFQDNLMNSIKAKEVSLIDTLKVNINNQDISELENSVNFIESLSNLGLKKGELQNTDDYDTFISKSMKFIPIFDIRANDLMDPKFIMVQTYNDTLQKWNDIKLFTVNDSIKNFYDKLSSKTIDIQLNDNSFIYKTGNSGNNWELQNLKDKTEQFKRFLTKEEIRDLLKTVKGIKLTII